MKVIGITGGIGSGKSSVLEYMEETFQAVVYQADVIAHQLQEPGQPCYDRIKECFGTTILNDDDTINRSNLGQIVFKDRMKLLQLNEILHPAVKNRVKALIAGNVEVGTPLFILEAALLIEDEYDVLCDELWYIYASETIRRTRLRKIRNYSEQKIDEIVNAQLPDAVFRRKCHRIIDNSGIFQDTCRQIKEVIYEIM